LKATQGGPKGTGIGKKRLPAVNVERREGDAGKELVKAQQSSRQGGGWMKVVENSYLRPFFILANRLLRGEEES